MEWQRVFQTAMGVNMSKKRGCMSNGYQSQRDNLNRSDTARFHNDFFNGA